MYWLNQTNRLEINFQTRPKYFHLETVLYIRLTILANSGSVNISLMYLRFDNKHLTTW